jgi:hypothetical protein
MILKNAAFVTSLVISWSAALAEQAVLRHAIQENHSVVHFQTQGVCSGLELRSTAVYCIPTSFLRQEGGSIGLGLFGEANEEAFKTASRVMENETNKADVDKLFRSENFQTVSVHGHTEAIYYQTRVSYSPIHAVGAVLINNPALPVVQFEGEKQSVFRVAQTFLFGYDKPVANYFLVVSPEVFYHKRKFYYADFDIVSIPAQKKELVSTKSDNGAGVDLSVGLIPTSNFLPGFGLRLENVNRSAKCDDCNESVFRLEQLFRARSEASLYLPWRHKFGGSIFGASTAFIGMFGEPDENSTALAYAYKIGGLEAFVAFSSIKTSFGFVFRPKVMDLGVTYTDEKQDNAISLSRRKNTFIYLGYAY